MIEVICYRCHQELSELGALVFSPPALNSITVNKLHICFSCWKSLLEWLHE